MDLRDGSASGVAVGPLHLFHPTSLAFMFPCDPLSVGFPPFSFAGPASVPGRWPPVRGHLGRSAESMVADGQERSPSIVLFAAAKGC